MDKILSRYGFNHPLVRGGLINVGVGLMLFGVGEIVFTQKSVWHGLALLSIGAIIFLLTSLQKVQK